MAQFFTDFSEYTVGQQPNNLVSVWDAPTSYIVNNDASGNYVYLIPSGDSTCLKYNDVPTSSDSEILVRIKNNATTGMTRIMLRLSDGPILNSYVLQNYYSNSLQLLKFVNGGYTKITSVSINVPSTAWFYMRFRVQGTTLYGKCWEDTATEPVSWQISTSDSSLNQGFCGVGLYNYYNNISISKIGIGTNGDVAPTGVLSVTPVTVQVDSKRQIQSNTSALIDTARNVTYLISATVNLDTQRILKNSTTVNTDLQRQIKSNITAMVDTQRSLTLTNPVFVDLSRKLAGIGSIATDTSRIIGTVSTIQSIIQPDTTSEQDVAVGTSYQWDQVYLHLFYQDAATNTPVLIQFNLSSIPDNATITHVELQLYAYSNSYYSGNNQIGAYKNLATFDHKTVTKSTLPSCNSTPTYTINETILINTWHTWDLTGDIQSSELVSNVVGWTLKSNVLNHGGDFVSGNSTDGAYRPKLVISYYIGTSAILALDSQRKLKKANSIPIDTERSITTVIIANAPVDTRRFLSGVISPILNDAKRIIVIPATDQADTKRVVTNQTSANVDSKRLLSSLVSVAGDSLRGLKRTFSILTDSARGVISTQGTSGNSKRTVINTNNINADSKRSLTNTLVFLGDLTRKTLGIVNFQGDALRKALNGASLGLDSFRKVVANSIIGLDMKRSLLNSVSVLADVLRFVRDTSQEIVMIDIARIIQASQNVTSQTKRAIQITTQILSDDLRFLRNLVSLSNDSVRSIENASEIVNDSERKPIVNVSMESETSRKLTGAIEFVFDSLRNIVNILIKKGSTYIFKDVKPIFYFKELLDNYSFKEVVQTFITKELTESYKWKGLSSVYQFRIGEEKEVGVEITAKDGTPFSLSAQWEYKGETGTCNIDGGKVFFVLKPTVIGNNQKANLTVTIMPTDIQKSREVLKPSLTVNVSA